MPDARALQHPSTGEWLQEGVDYYLEGTTLVFTAVFHLKRGECCGSGCRHCPWADAPPNNS